MKQATYNQIIRHLGNDDDVTMCYKDGSKTLVRKETTPMRVGLSLSTRSKDKDGNPGFPWPIYRHELLAYAEPVSIEVNTEW